MHIAPDLGIMTLPIYQPSLTEAPTLADRVDIAAAVQDEFGWPAHKQDARPGRRPGRHLRIGTAVERYQDGESLRKELRSFVADTCISGAGTLISEGLLTGEFIMRLGYFTMPMHPLNTDYTTTLKQDREAIILCDKLGYHDAFVGEHLTDDAENITNSMLFLGTLIHSTENIMLGTGTTNLTHTHPVLVASHAAMFDHLAEGRFILGVSPGTLRSDREVLGIANEDINIMFADAIDVILAIWDGQPPYKIDLPNNRWVVTTEVTLDASYGTGIMQKPYQQPRPEIIGTVVAPYSNGVIEMGKRGFHPISANFLFDKWAGTHWAGYAEGCEAAGRTADPTDWRIARTVFVADDDKIAEAYGKTDANSPYRFYYSQLIYKLTKGGRQAVFKHDRDEPDDVITIDRVLDDLVICGTVESVVDQILALREVTGPFGELVIAGMDWVDEDLTKRSLQLMAEEVMPRVNAALSENSEDAVR